MIMRIDGPSTKDRLYNICTMRAFAKQLIGKGKPYEKLLKTILLKDYWYNDDIEIPNIKEFAELVNLPYDKARKYINMIYEDLYDQEENHVKFCLKKVVYEFYLKYFDNRAYVTFHELPIVPRVGEEIEIAYFKDTVKTTWFYVESIRHQYTDRLQRVIITCRSGNSNRYWNWRKDKAFFTGEITWDEYYKEDDYMLRDKIRISPH